MSVAYDLIIRNATVYDGSGAPGRQADVAVRAGRIEAVGSRLGEAAETIDADGLALCPGIIDVHTHYDAQLTWDPLATPSVALGVTTVVAGNCGFGIAPCAPDMREIMMENLAVVEGIDIAALRAGMRWDYETFGEYREQLRRSGTYPNVGILAGHTPIRITVMGAESAKREATEEEIGRMQTMLRDAMAAGAIGYSTSISANHTGFAGLPVPSRLASQAEHDAMFSVVKEAGFGVVGTVGQQQNAGDLERIARLSGRPVVFNAALHTSTHPNKAMDYLDGCADANRRGHSVYALVSDLPLAMDFTLENAFAFYSNPAWDRVRHAQGAELRAGLADRGFRDAFAAALRNPTSNMPFQGNWSELEVTLPATSRNADLEGLTIAEAARRRNAEPLDLLFDLALDEDLATRFTSYAVNGDEDAVEPLITHEAALISASDAGAHVEFMCNAHYGLHLFGRWVRERKALELSEAVRMLTSFPADLFRIEGRGRIRPGDHADLLLFDPATVAGSAKRQVADLPGGCRRMIRQPLGVAGVWVNGRKVFDGSAHVLHSRPPGMLI